MKKRALLLLLAMLLAMALGTTGAFATEEGVSPLSVEVDSILQQAEVLETDAGILYVLETRAGIVAVVRNFTELEAALKSNDAIGAYMINDIQMEYELMIERDFTFEVPLGEVTLYSALDNSHFWLYDDTSVDFANLILDGRNNSGGLIVANGCSLKNVTMQHCTYEENNAMNRQGALACSDTYLENVNVIDSIGNGIYGGDIILKNCRVQGSTKRGIVAGRIEITDSIVSHNLGGGVHALYNMIFNSGSIYDNVCSMDDIGGGIKVGNDDLSFTEFQMYGGELYNNSVQITSSNNSYGGGIAAINTYVQIYGGEIHNNTAYFGGGIATLDSDYGSIGIVEILDCNIYDNYAIVGGGIYSNSITMFDGEIYNNTASQEGGGVAVESMVMLDGHIYDNKAMTGGGIYTEWYIEMMGGSIKNNHAAADGGGIYIDENIYYSPIALVAGILSGNNADGNGGAIGISYDDFWLVQIGEDFIFSDNTASEGYLITDPDDKFAHEVAIFTKHFSTPFTQYAYNNYDIEYTQGININDAVIINFFLTKGNDVHEVAYTTPGTALSELPEAPILDGYQFVGWYDAEGNLFDSNSIITENLNLYAAWLIL